MRLTARIVSALSLALWLGGLIMLFTAVSTLFATFDRTTAGLGATGIFQKFERYQIVLAVIAMASAAASLRPSRSAAVTLALLVLATISSLLMTFVLSPKIDALRIAGETHTPAFGKLHGIAMSVYVGITALVAGAIIASVVNGRERTSSTASAGRAFPAVPAGSAPVG